MEMFYMTVSPSHPVSVRLEVRGLTPRDEGHIQTTRTNEFVGEDWVKSMHPTDERYGSIPRVHYRLVTKRAGFRLSNFRGTRELLSATFDVFIGTEVVRHTGAPLNTPTL